MKDDTKIKTVIWTVVLAFFLVSANCVKKRKPDQYRYPEDPGTTTLTPQERLTAVWSISDYQFNGNSIVSQLDTLNDGKARIREVGVYYDYSLDYKQWRFTVSNKYFQFDGDQAFNPNEPYDITFYGSANPYLCKWFITPFRYNINQANLRTRWSITKLYKNDLNLLLHTDSGDYKIFLIKQ